MDQISEKRARWLLPLGPDLPPLYLVGGAVRDYFLDRPVKDIDLMTADPESLASCLGALHNAAVVPFVKKADAPCFRVVNRNNPDDFLDLVAVRGGSVLADLSLRDFTINAMAVQILAGGIMGELIDPLNGREDLGEKLIRTVGPDAFQSDPLRLLRAFRFSAQLSFKIEENTLRAIKESAVLISNVSVERIWAELEMILNQPDSSESIRMMDRLGILESVFPEISAMKGCQQNDFHHLDVWDHCLAVLSEIETILSDLSGIFGDTALKIRETLAERNRLVGLKLTALLHDIGKPASSQEDGVTGKITFYGHDEKGGELVTSITNRLKLSQIDREGLQLLAINHMHALFLSHPDVREATVLRWFRRLGDDMIPLIILSLADSRATLGPASSPEDRSRHEAWVVKTIQTYYGSVKTHLAQKPLVTGDDLIKMGLKPGPEVGRILKQLREAQDNGVVKTKEEGVNLAEELFIMMKIYVKDA